MHKCPLHLLSYSAGVESTWADGDEADGLANIGEKVSHVCTITNEGTTSLVSFCITSDSFGEDGCQECPGAGTLAPGATFTCTIDTEVHPFRVLHPLDYHDNSKPNYIVVQRKYFTGLFSGYETWHITTYQHALSSPVVASMQHNCKVYENLCFSGVFDQSWRCPFA